MSVTVAESLIHGLCRVSEWCDLWGMKLNATKTKTMIVSRSCTMHLQSLPLTIGRTVLKESDDLHILWMTFDSKMTFEKHLRSVARAASQRLGILRKSWRVFHDWSLLRKFFRNCVLPVLEYCSAVWCSATDTHPKLLDRVVSNRRFLTGGVFECNIAHRRSVAVLRTWYKIMFNQMHHLYDALPLLYEIVWVMLGPQYRQTPMCHHVYVLRNELHAHACCSCVIWISATCQLPQPRLRFSVTKTNEGIEIQHGRPFLHFVSLNFHFVNLWQWKLSHPQINFKMLILFVPFK